MKSEQDSDASPQQAPRKPRGKSVKRSKSNKRRDTLKKLAEQLGDFRTTDSSFKPKPIDLKQETDELNEFRKYLEEDKLPVKLSRGLRYVLWARPCEYRNAKEAFRLNAYDEREGVVKLDKIREERDELQVKYRKKMTEMIALVVKKIRCQRILREETYEPRVVARSSGHPGNSYVYGYGYTYGVGYTDNDKAATAPGYEITATNCVKRMIKKFSPVVGQGDFEQLYRDIFNIKHGRRSKLSSRITLEQRASRQHLNKTFPNPEPI